MFDPVAQLEADAASAGIPIADLLKDANVAQTTWWRWQTNRFEARTSTIRKLHEALDKRRRAASAKRGAAA